MHQSTRVHSLTGLVKFVFALTFVTSDANIALLKLTQFFLRFFQSMFDYLDNAVIKLCEMSTVGTDLGTVKQQIEELKVGKSTVIQHKFKLPRDEIFLKY